MLFRELNEIFSCDTWWPARSATASGMEGAPARWGLVVASVDAGWHGSEASESALAPEWFKRVDEKILDVRRLGGVFDGEKDDPKVVGGDVHDSREVLDVFAHAAVEASLRFADVDRVAASECDGGAGSGAS